MANVVRYVLEYRTRRGQWIGTTMGVRGHPPMEEWAIEFWERRRRQHPGEVERLVALYDDGTERVFCTSEP